MSKLVKTMTLPIRPNTTSSRLAEEVSAMEAVNRQQVPGEMRQWLLAGFELGQLQHGILESWLAMANGGQLKHMNSRERGEVLKQIIDRTVWLDEPTPMARPVSSRPTPKPKPEPKEIQEIMVYEEASTDEAGVPTSFDLAGEL